MIINKGGEIMAGQKLWAQIIGIVLILVGILGFFMSSPLLGFFGVNGLHNGVHIVTGLIFLWAGFAGNAPVKKVNQWLGVIYILIGIVGFFVALTFLNMEAGMDPDNWLHLVIGVVSAIVGWTAK